MSLIDNQEHLIAQTQLLYDELLNSGKYAEAIAIGKLILDLSTAYKELGTIYTPPAKSSEPSWAKNRHSFGTAFGQSAFSQINQTVREVIPPLYVREERYKANQFSEPPQPSRYSWSDGFQGVTVPPREVDTPLLPSPNAISSQPTDYWEDNRRQ